MNRAILFPAALFALAALSLAPDALAGKPQKVPFEAGGLAMYDMPHPRRLEAVLVADDGSFVGSLSESLLHDMLRSALYIEGTVELMFDDEGVNTLNLEIHERRRIVRELSLFAPVRWTVTDGTGVFAGVEGSGELFWNVLDSETAEFDLIGELVFP